MTSALNWLKEAANDSVIGLDVIGTAKAHLSRYNPLPFKS
jgi:hypothetical protein